MKPRFCELNEDIIGRWICEKLYKTKNIVNERWMALKVIVTYTG